MRAAVLASVWGATQAVFYSPSEVVCRTPLLPLELPEALPLKKVYFVLQLESSPNVLLLVNHGVLA